MLLDHRWMGVISFLFPGSDSDPSIFLMAYLSQKGHISFLLLVFRILVLPHLGQVNFFFSECHMEE